MEGEGGKETLYIENLNWFQKSGFIQQYIVLSPVWSVSLVSWFPYRGSGSFHKALGGWGICIIWRNLNSIFCSVTFQSAYSIRPCIELSSFFFFFIFYSQPPFKKRKKNKPSYILCESSRGLFVNIANKWTVSYPALNQCRIAWNGEQAQFDLFSWSFLDITSPQGFPGLFFLSSLCRKRCGQGVPASSEVSESPVQRSVASMKFCSNSYKVLWSFLPLGCCYSFLLSCPFLTFYYIMPRLFAIVTQKADMSYLSQAELSLLSYS